MKAWLLARLRQERPEAGETLIEVMISSALMALLVVAIVGGLATVLISSRIHRNQADGNVSLVKAMEKVRSETSPSCALNDASHPYRVGLPAGVTISSIEYQTTGSDSSGNSILVWSPSNSVCCDLSSPLSLQRITLQYVNADSSVNPSLSFVKGKF
jgi:Tfp pilus assembly protein PilV